MSFLLKTDFIEKKLPNNHTIFSTIQNNYYLHITKNQHFIFQISINKRCFNRNQNFKKINEKFVFLNKKR